MKTATTKPDLFQEVTNSIIAQLEQGAAPLVKPWNSDGGHPGASNFTAASAAQYINDGRPTNIWHGITAAHLLRRCAGATVSILAQPVRAGRPLRARLYRPLRQRFNPRPAREGRAAIIAQRRRRRCGSFNPRPAREGRAARFMAPPSARP